MAQNSTRSTRTPYARVRGLGASGHGAEHWWLQRVTAAANLPLVIVLAAILVSLLGRTYAEAIALVSHPVVAILLCLAVISISVHMRLGVQVILEDYVHDKGLKLAALMANTFFSALVAVASLYAILKIGLGRLL